MFQREWWEKNRMHWEGEGGGGFQQVRFRDAVLDLYWVITARKSHFLQEGCNCMDIVDSTIDTPALGNVEWGTCYTTTTLHFIPLFNHPTCSTHPNPANPFLPQLSKPLNPQNLTHQPGKKPTATRYVPSSASPTATPPSHTNYHSAPPAD